MSSIEYFSESGVISACICNIMILLERIQLGVLGTTLVREMSSFGEMYVLL